MTTRSGTYKQNRETGASQAVLESRTMASRLLTNLDKSSDSYLQASITTSRKESSMSVRKESVMNSAAVAASGLGGAPRSYRSSGRVPYLPACVSKSRLY